jgi:4-amino-4-deoxy-L-arabinose transferase and related glycosyltransferases of PMT family
MKSEEKTFRLLLAIWVCADFVTALFAGFHADEAYYSLYGAHLAWGYYDHPPMVALLTHCSSLLFDGILGIRFFTTLLHGGTLWLIWKTLDEEERHAPRAAVEFCIIAASMTLFVAYGVITTPDAPLLFFTALFFYLYKKYVGMAVGETYKSPKGWLLATGIAFSVAAMLYSKYMGILVVGFVLLSNLRLLRDVRVWYAMILALMLFMPHLLWQINNHFPSFSFHLVERNLHFRWAYPLKFIPDQMLAFNPVAFCLAMFFCWKRRKTKDRFERALLFSIVGFILFFWVMTLKGRSEPQWTVAASVPMLILLFRALHEEPWRKWIYRLFLPIAVLLFLARIILCINVLPDESGIRHDPSKMEAVHQLAGDRPVVFVTSFQKPALYRFYTGGEATAISTIYGRRTQYDILLPDTAWQGKPVLLVGRLNNVDNMVMDDPELRYYSTDNFQCNSRMEVKLLNYRVEGDSLWLQYTIHNPYSVAFNFLHPEFPTILSVDYQEGDGFEKFGCPTPANPVIPAGATVSGTAKVPWKSDEPMFFAMYNGLFETACSQPFVIGKNESGSSRVRD